MSKIVEPTVFNSRNKCSHFVTAPVKSEQNLHMSNVIRNLSTCETKSIAMQDIAVQLVMNETCLCELQRHRRLQTRDCLHADKRIVTWW